MCIRDRAIINSITETSKKGTTYGASTELETLVAKKIVENIMDYGMPKDTLLNVNVPYCKQHEIKGIRITRQGSHYFEDYFYLSY